MATEPPARRLTIDSVRTNADRRRFIRMAHTIYRDQPHWVAPLHIERERFLDAHKNPWFEHGKAELFLALEGNAVVGRIAAVEDPRFNEFHGTSLGMFGMFECVDDVGVAQGLFDAAAEWLRARGYPRMFGPVGFSTNYEWGVLLDGFGEAPTIMMPYSARYYPKLYEACGFLKAKDIHAWDLPLTPPESVVEAAGRLRVRNGIVTRPMDLGRFAEEIETLRDIYNSAWEKNWGFVPMSSSEWTRMSWELRRYGRPELVMLAEVEGRPAASSMALPDLNVALALARGRLTSLGVPIGLARLLRGMRRIRRIRFVTMGVKDAFRGLGVATVLLVDTLRNAARLGYTACEAGWTLEDNVAVAQLLESFGAHRTKTYRSYERPI